MKNEIAVYKPTLDPEFFDGDEELGIDEIAFTSKPAIKIKGVAFSSQEKHKFSADDVKMRIAAPVLVPMEIYRSESEDMPEHYIEFTEDETEAIFVDFMQKFNSEKKPNGLFNEEHDTSKRVPAYLLEIWLVENPKKDKSFTTFGVLCPKKTIFAVAQLTDRDVYDELVENDQVGFSIEGFLGLKLRSHENNNRMKKRIYSKEKKQHFAEIKSVSKWAKEIDQDTVDVGTKLTSTGNWDGATPYTVAAGEYEDENGKRFLVDSEGIVRMFIDDKVEPTIEASEDKTDVVDESKDKTKMSDETINEPVIEETEMETDEKPAEEKKDEAVELEETPVDFSPEQKDVINAMIKEKTDELIDMIAELKSLVEGEASDVDETVDGEVQMKRQELSAHDRVQAVRDYLVVLAEQKSNK